MLFCWFRFPYCCDSGYPRYYPHRINCLYYLKKRVLLTTVTTGSLSAILTDVSSFVTSGISWVGSYVGAITSNPLIEAFVIVSFVGLGIGLIKRLVRV